MDKKEIQEKINNLSKPECIYNRYDGVIRKLEKIGKNQYVDSTGIVTDLDKHGLLGKTRKNIIELVENGDLVNGYIVNEVRISCWDSLLYANDYNNQIKQEDIKEILTHEQLLYIHMKKIVIRRKQMEKIKTIIIVILCILLFAMSTYAGYYKGQYERVERELNEMEERYEENL